LRNRNAVRADPESLTTHAIAMADTTSACLALSDRYRLEREFRPGRHGHGYLART
jgi:hypothetical protein